MLGCLIQLVFAMSMALAALMLHSYLTSPFNAPPPGPEEATRPYIRQKNAPQKPPQTDASRRSARSTYGSEDAVSARKNSSSASGASTRNSGESDEGAKSGGDPRLLGTWYCRNDGMHKKNVSFTATSFRSTITFWPNKKPIICSNAYTTSGGYIWASDLKTISVNEKGTKCIIGGKPVDGKMKISYRFDEDSDLFLEGDMYTGSAWGCSKTAPSLKRAPPPVKTERSEDKWKPIEGGQPPTPSKPSTCAAGSSCSVSI